VNWARGRKTEDRRQSQIIGGRKMQISHFTDLKVYQKAGDLAAVIFNISK
jgi:hypothetical protein